MGFDAHLGYVVSAVKRTSIVYSQMAFCFVYHQIVIIIIFFTTNRETVCLEGNILQRVVMRIIY